MTLGELRQSRMAEVESRYLKDLLDFTGGDIDRCCTIAGLSRSRLYALLQKYRITGRA
jgi:two-component system NtrC family response regulator